MNCSICNTSYNSISIRCPKKKKVSSVTDFEEMIGGNMFYDCHKQPPQQRATDVRSCGDSASQRWSMRSAVRQFYLLN